MGSTTRSDDFNVNYNANDKTNNNVPAEFQQLLLRSCGMDSSGGSDTSSMNSLMVYAQQLVAVATVAQQFAAASSLQPVTATKTVMSPLPQRKSTTKKSVVSTKREKLTKNDTALSPYKAHKYSNVVKEETDSTIKADTKRSNANFPTTTAANDFWANLSSLTTAPAANNSIFTATTSIEHTCSFVEADNTNKDTEANCLPRECDIAERKRPAAIQELLQMKRARLNNNTVASGPDLISVNSNDLVQQKKFSKLEILDENTFLNEEVANYKQKSLSNHDTANKNDGFLNSQWPNDKEDDTETTSSYNTSAYSDQQHQSSQIAEEQQPVQKDVQEQSQKQLSLTLEEAQNLLLTSSVNEAEVSSEASSRAVADLIATLNSNGETRVQYLNAIQNHPISGKLTGIRSPLKNTSTPPNRLPSRTNDNDVCESFLSSLVPHDRVFAHVPGRLSLLSNVVKYKMSVGEVKRRLMGPESFNFSLLGALLRRAKMPEKSQMLVDELNQVGLSIPRGRRRLSQVTLLSALTESESVQFAKDFQRVAEAEFPATSLAELSARRILTVHNNKHETVNSDKRVGQLNAALNLAQEFVELLDQDRSPVMDSNPDPVYERNIQDPLSTFSMLTHGFGTPAIRVGVKMLITFLERQQQFLRNHNST